MNQREGLNSVVCYTFVLALRQVARHLVSGWIREVADECLQRVDAVEKVTKTKLWNLEFETIESKKMDS